jgi:glycosyltransferase involved in cell wall biosynthesis
MKKILIDLSILKHIDCGLGQVAYNYAKYFEKNAGSMDFEVHLLVPKRYVGAFGKDVHYHISNKIYTIFPFLFPKFDLWHSIHQLSRFKPSRRSTKQILTIHDINFIYEKRGLKREKYAQYFEKKIQRADRLVSISQFTRTDVMKHFPTDKPITVIYNGVEFSPVSSGTMPDIPVLTEKKFLFSIGQIRWKKNFHVMLDAMKLMPEYNLIISGSVSTDYAEMIRKRIADEKIENIFLTGNIKHSEKVWLYAHCEAFVFPSLFEGFGLPVIEVMSFGKPVISSDKTSLKEIDSNHVFFLKNFQPEHIAEKIREAIDSYKKNPKMVTENENYAKGFTYDNHMASYISIYRELLMLST